MATLLVASVFIAMFAIRESTARRRAEEAKAAIDTLRRDERHQVYWANLHLAQQAWQSARVNHMRQYLQQAIPNHPETDDLRDFEWHYLWRLLSGPKFVFQEQSNTSNVVFSPDGKSIFSASVKGNVRIFDTTTGELQAELPGKGLIDALAISQDGKQLAVGYRDKPVYVWDLDLQNIVHTLVGHDYPVRALVFSPDGSRLVSGDETDKVIAWSTADGQRLWTVSKPKLYAMDLSYDRSGRRIAVGRGQVVILDADSAEELATIDAHSNWLTGVAFSPNDQQLATSSEDRTAKVWNLVDGSLALQLVGHNDCLTGIAYSPDGETIGTSSRDGTVKLWDAETGSHRMNLIGHSNWVTSLCFSPDSQQIASVSMDDIACLWRPDPNWETRTLATREASVTSLAYGSRSKAMYIADAMGKVLACDVHTGSTLHEFQAHPTFISDVKLSQSESILATASHDDSIKVWNAETGQELQELRGHQGDVRTVAISPDERRLYSASEDGTIREWDLTTGAELHQLHSNTSLLAMALSPDGRLLASSGTTRIQLWDTSTWNEVKVLSSHTHALSSLAFSHDGRILASGGSDRTICLWETETGNLLHRLLGHANLVASLSFNRSGSRLVSSSHDGTIRIWDTTSGHELLALDHHQSWINGLIVDPLGKFIATCSRDQTVKLTER